MATIKMKDWETPESLAVAEEELIDMGGRHKTTEYPDPSTYDYSVRDNTLLNIEQTIAILKSKQEKTIDGDEKEFQRCFVSNLMDICKGLGLAPPKCAYEQKREDVENFSIITDVICLHTDNTVTIFEMKKAPLKYSCTSPKNQMDGIGQCLLYKNVWESLIGGAVRVALVDEKIHYRTFCALCGYKIPITLIEFQDDHVFVPYNGW